MRGALRGLIALAIVCAAAADAHAQHRITRGYGGAFSSSPVLIDDMDLQFGSPLSNANAAFIQLDTAQTNGNALSVGLPETGRFLFVQEAGDRSCDRALANAATPGIFVWSTACNATDFLSLRHDGTNGLVDVGTGALRISDNLDIQGNSLVTAATTLASTELDRLDGKDAALVDVNDAVATAITSTSAATFSITGDLTVTGGDVVLGTTNILSGGDTASLNEIDAMNATTEATVEAAIDTLANLTAASALVTVGALNSGSIASGFGAIDNGADAITTTGIVGTLGSTTFAGDDASLRLPTGGAFVIDGQTNTNTLTTGGLDIDYASSTANAVAAFVTFHQTGAAVDGHTALTAFFGTTVALTGTQSRHGFASPATANAGDAAGTFTNAFRASPPTGGPGTEVAMSVADGYARALRVTDQAAVEAPSLRTTWGGSRPTPAEGGPIAGAYVDDSVTLQGVTATWGTAGTGGATGVVVEVNCAGSSSTCTIGACTITANTPTRCALAAPINNSTDQICSVYITSATDCAGNPTDVTLIVDGNQVP